VFLLTTNYERSPPKDCLKAFLLQELLDKRFSFLIGALANMAIPDDTFFVDQNCGRPGPDPVTLPNLEAVVLHDRIADPHLLRCRFYLVQRFLPEKLRRVDSYNCKTLLFVFVVPASQLRDNVFAVNSAVGPKLEHDNAPL
jgi:hypothetical protein